jgi:hypothetical protein
MEIDYMFLDPDIKNSTYVMIHPIFPLPVAGFRWAERGSADLSHGDSVQEI